MAQAIMRSQSSNGPVEDWYSDVNMNAKEYFEQYFKPYLQINKTCSGGLNCGYESITPWKHLNGDVYIWNLSNDTSSRLLFHLSDGTFVAVKTGEYPCAEYDENGQCIKNEFRNDTEPTIIVDINGAKKPNMLGRDVFLMQINKEYGVVPYCNHADKDTVNNNCKKGGNGSCCLKKIMNDSWNFSDSYPI